MSISRLCAKCKIYPRKPHSSYCRECCNAYANEWQRSRRVKAKQNLVSAKCFRCGIAVLVPEPRNPSLLFCSSVCRKRLYATIKCARCGKKIRRRLLFLGKPTKVGRFCSTSCRARAAAKRGPESPKYNRITQHCEICGRSAERMAYLRNVKYLCSKECYVEWFGNYHFDSLTC